MHIDIAAAADIPQLNALLSILFTQEAEFAPDTSAQARGLALIIGNPAVGAILVAREGNEALGMVNLLFTVSTALGAKVALLDDLVVKPERRGTGIGTRLLDRAIAFACEQACRRITLNTDPSNESARRIYQKHGFVTSNMIPMRLLLT